MSVTGFLSERDTRLVGVLTATVNVDATEMRMSQAVFSGQVNKDLEEKLPAASPAVSTAGALQAAGILSACVGRA
jgi:hypothetical protein